jgi:hypothetical protein
MIPRPQEAIRASTANPSDMIAYDRVVGFHRDIEN